MRREKTSVLGDPVKTQNFQVNFCSPHPAIDSPKKLPSVLHKSSLGKSKGNAVYWRVIEYLCTGSERN